MATDYPEQVKNLSEKYEGFENLVQKLESLKGKNARILHFSHHDLDGVTSGAILKKIFEDYLDAEVTVKIPFGFRLDPDELEEPLKREDYGILVISDKGTFGYYDDFTEEFKDVLVIDHHLKDGMPEDCIVFNPSAHQEVRTSTAHMAHMLATYFDVADEYDDFITLLGCRGDYVITPEVNQRPDFVAPFLESVKTDFDYLFKERSARPTLFDTDGRKNTALLNQIGEVLHISTLSHLYSSVSEDVSVEHGAQFALKTLEEFAAEEKSLEFESLEAFLSVIPKSKQISRVFDLFKKDWDMLGGRVDNAVFLEEVENVGIYLVFAREAPAMESVSFPAILPYVASASLEDFKEEGNHEAALAIVFCPKEIGTHVSMRGGGGILSCDAMCRELVERVQEERPESEGDIGGGGHEVAAECVAGTSLKMYVVMRELTSVLEDLKAKPEKYKASS